MHGPRVAERTAAPPTNVMKFVPPHSPKAPTRSTENSPHLRRSRDNPSVKTGTLTGGSGGVQVMDRPMSLVGLASVLPLRWNMSVSRRIADERQTLHEVTNVP